MNTPNKMPKQDIEEILKEFEEKFVLDPTSWRDNPLGFSVPYVAKTAEQIESFLRQKLTLVREEGLREASVGLEKMTIKNPKCDCKTHLEHNCDFTSNEAISDALSHLKQLKQK